MANNAYTPNANHNGGGLSWAVVIVVLIIFWPVGIYLLYRKLTSDKKAAMTSGNVVFIVGLALLCLGIFAVIVGPSDPAEAVSGRIEYLVIFVGTGLALRLIGFFGKARAARYKKYIALIINQRITSMDNIAAAVPAKYESVVKDLQKMINIGYFAGAYINSGSRDIVLPQVQGPAMGQAPGNTYGAAPGQLMDVICKNCGANNQIAEGQAAECEYCGSPLSAG